MSLFKELQEAKTDNARTTIIGKLSESFKMVEDAFTRCSQGKEYFGGDNIGYLDIVLGSYLGWMTVLEVHMKVKCIDETSTPGLAAWAKRMYSDSQVKVVLPSVQKILNFIESSRLLQQTG